MTTEEVYLRVMAQNQWLRAFNEAVCESRPVSVYDHPWFPGRFTMFYKGFHP